MRILHICLASAYTEGMTYQDNILPDQNAKDGHDVIIISDCHKYEGGNMVYTPPEDIILSNGVRLIRLEYDKIINNFISSKIRRVSPLYNLIINIAPDVILFHGVAGWEMLNIAKYKKLHTKVKLYIDSHEDYNNSATNFISRIIQYKWFNKSIVKKVLPYVDKILCVGYECFYFLSDLYNIPDNKMEFYPLGGIIPDENIRQEKRHKIRKKLELQKNDILIIHSGKMDKLKRTEEILKAFAQVKSDKLKLILIGSMEDKVKQVVDPLISHDERVDFLGWKNGNELMEFLCACDLYVQPGGQSATMQNALCCGSAAALYPHESHKYLLNNSVFYVETIEDMKKVFKDIAENRELLEDKRAKTNKIAHEMLDYKVLASRLYK